MAEGLGKVGIWEDLWGHPEKQMRSPELLVSVPLARWGIVGVTAPWDSGALPGL